MDPTLNLCRVYDSFSQSRPIPEAPVTFSFGDEVPEVVQNIQATTKDNLEPLLVDPELYSRLTS